MSERIHSRILLAVDPSTVNADTEFGMRRAHEITLDDDTYVRVGGVHDGREVEEISVQTIDGKDDNAVIMYDDGPSSQPTGVKK